MIDRLKTELYSFLSFFCSFPSRRHLESHPPPAKLLLSFFQFTFPVISSSVICNCHFPSCSYFSAVWYFVFPEPPISNRNFNLLSFFDCVAKQVSLDLPFSNFTLLSRSVTFSLSFPPLKPPSSIVSFAVESAPFKPHPVSVLLLLSPFCNSIFSSRTITSPLGTIF
jgi:hypothetical protein